MKPSRFILALLLGYHLFSATPAIAWEEIKGEHFIVLMPKTDGFGRDVLSAAEKSYRDIATNLGYPRHSEFWIWDQRVKIYLHADKEAYLKITQEKGWSEGVADYANREIHSYLENPDLIGSIIPHEIAHLILRDFVGFGENIPVWLDEGVAQWAEQNEAKKSLKEKAAELFNKDSLLSLKDIFTLNIRWVAQQEKRLFLRSVKTKSGALTVLVLSPDVLVDVFYAAAGSLVDYLLGTFGAPRFADLCRELRDGKPVEEAIALAYPDHFKNTNDLEREWRKSLL